MSILSEIATGFLTAMANNAASPLGGYQDRGRIDRLVRSLGWSIQERDGDTLHLHFKDQNGSIRKLFVSSGDEPLVRFAVYSHAILPAKSVPEQVISYLLVRNRDIPIGGWHVTLPDRDGDVLFAVQYSAFGAGMTADLFRFTCEAMIREACEFDDKMRGVGLVR